MSTTCLTCGACCFSDSDAYVPVSQEDEARLRAHPDGSALVVTRDGARYLRMQQGRCAALTYRHGQFFCAVYTHRPTPCRTLERGTPECQAERTVKLRLSRRWMRREENDA